MTRPIVFERFIVSPSRFLEFPLIYHYIVAFGTIAKGSLLFDIHDHAVLGDADTRDCPQLSVQVREGAVWQWFEVEFLHEMWQFVTGVLVEGEAFHYLDSGRGSTIQSNRMDGPGICKSLLPATILQWRKVGNVQVFEL